MNKTLRLLASLILMALLLLFLAAAFASVARVR